MLRRVLKDCVLPAAGFAGGLLLVSASPYTLRFWIATAIWTLAYAAFAALYGRYK
jgi:arginine exporter protein ArgO